jgi:hypothetical protein
MLRPTDTPRTHDCVGGPSKEHASANAKAAMTRNSPNSEAAPHSFQLMSQNLLYSH